MASAELALRRKAAFGFATLKIRQAQRAAQAPPWASLATRWFSRETLRLAALACTTPFCAERMITGSASLSAARARLRSPVAIASSTLRTKLRNFERRLLLI